MLAFATSIAWAEDRTISENYKLTSNEIVDGVLTVEKDVTVDLNGHRLTVQGLAGEGAITGDPDFVSSDLTSPDTREPYHVTWVTKFSTGNDVEQGSLRDGTTTPRNLFNDSALEAETNDNDKRILVKSENLPLAVTYDFGAGEQRNVTKYRLYMTRNKYYNRGPKEWKFEGSDDKKIWDRLDFKSDIVWSAYNAISNPYKEYEITNETSYRYYRIVFISSSDTSYLELNQLEYFDTCVQPVLHISVPDGVPAQNSSIAITGKVKVVKDGEGEFVEAKEGQTYEGGTVISEGAYALEKSASLDWSTITLGTDLEKPVSLRISEDAVLSNIPDNMIVGSTNVNAIVYKETDSWSINGSLFLNYSGASTNKFYHNGGEISVGRLALPRTGSGEFNMNGGKATVGSDGVVFGSSSVGGYALLSLNGGEFSTPFVKYHNGTQGKATVRFNGGILKITESGSLARGDNNPSGGNFSGIDTLKRFLFFTVAKGGGTINIANNDVTMPLAISEDPESTGGGMKFIGGGSITLGATPSYTGGTIIEAGTVLKFSKSTKSALFNLPENVKLKVEIPAAGAVGGQAVMELLDDGEFTQEDMAKVEITGADAGRYTLSLTEDLKKIVIIDASAGEYVWKGGASGASWKTPGNWLKGSVAGDWYDSTQAVFEGNGDSVSVDAPVTAASVAFRADAIISGPAVLSVAEVSVSEGVSAVISAPTAGPLTKTGLGSLKISSDRSDYTTLSEGTLVLDGEATLDWSKFTFGTVQEKPVVLRVGESATLANITAGANGWELGNVQNVTSTVHKDGGEWNLEGKFALGAPGALARFIHEGGTMTTGSRFAIGDSNGAGYFEINGGTVSVTGDADTTRPLIGVTSEGEMVVKNGGKFEILKNSLYVGINANSKGVLTIDNGGNVEVSKDLIYNLNNANSEGKVYLKSGGTISVCQMYRNNDGGATFNFDGGTLVAKSENNKLFSKAEGTGEVAVTISGNGGTIDNGNNSVEIANTITGNGGLTLIGSGTTIISTDQTYKGCTTVSSGTTLLVPGTTSVAFSGPIALKAGSKLNLASYTSGVTPLSAEALTLPEDGTVDLTLNGGAFKKGVYIICSAPGVSKAYGEKFAFTTTDNLSSEWSVDDNRLLLTVGSDFGNFWTGLTGDGKMSSNGNWADGTAPVNGEEVDFSGITVSTTIDADIANVTFGTVTMGSGAVIFTNVNMKAKFSDTSKVAVAPNSTVTLDGNLEFRTNVESYVCRYIFEGGKFVVTGNIIATTSQTGDLFPHLAKITPGSICANGLVNNASRDDVFCLVQKDSDYGANWQIGEGGISGSKRFIRGHSGGGGGGRVTITATADFTVSADIVQFSKLTLIPNGHKITLGTDVARHEGGILGGRYDRANGLTTISGPGKVLLNYNVTNLTDNSNSRKNAFTVADGGTLAIVPGASNTFSTDNNGMLTVKDGATLEFAQSGEISLGGALTLENNAILKFNFTDRATAPVLALPSDKTVAFSGGSPVNIAVKVSGVWPRCGEYSLTTCGGFAAEGVRVLPASGEKMIQDISINESGNIVLRVKPMGTKLVIR